MRRETINEMCLNKMHFLNYFSLFLIQSCSRLVNFNKTADLITTVLNYVFNIIYFIIYYTFIYLLVFCWDRPRSPKGGLGLGQIRRGVSSPGLGQIRRGVSSRDSDSDKSAAEYRDFQNGSPKRTVSVPSTPRWSTTEVDRGPAVAHNHVL